MVHGPLVCAYLHSRGAPPRAEARPSIPPVVAGLAGALAAAFCTVARYEHRPRDTCHQQPCSQAVPGNSVVARSVWCGVVWWGGVGCGVKHALGRRAWPCRSRCAAMMMMMMMMGCASACSAACTSACACTYSWTEWSVITRRQRVALRRANREEVSEHTGERATLYYSIWAESTAHADQLPC